MQRVTVGTLLHWYVLPLSLFCKTLAKSKTQGLIKRMIGLEPSDRPSFDALLHQSRGNVFPESFYSSLHDFILSVNDISASNPFAAGTQSTGDSTPTTASAPSKLLTVDEKTAYADRASSEQQDKSTPLPTGLSLILSSRTSSLRAV